MPSLSRLPLAATLLATALTATAARSLTAAPAVAPTVAPTGPADAVAPAEGLLVAFQPRAAHAQRLAAVSRLGMELDPAVSNPYFARLRVPAGQVPVNPVAQGALQAQGDVAAQAERAAVARKTFIRQRVAKAFAAARSEATIRVAEPDYECTIDALPNDPSFASLWGLHNTGQGGGTPDADIDAPEAWDKTVGSDSVIVAVIDTGVDYTHPDLKDNILKDANGAVVGYDYVNNDADPMDDNGHGTHCAGTIGARGNNGLGISGVSQRVKIMPLKFLPASGSGSQSAAIRCIDFARTNGAKIMSNSWGSDGGSTLLREAIQRAQAAGILFVAAAGNSGRNTDSQANYPSYYTTTLDNVVSVGATTSADARASFSNYGSNTVDLGAPGQGIYSSWPGGGYATLNGTSMATPHVSGAAALALAANPQLTPAQLKAALVSSSDRPAALSGLFEGGRLNVNSLLGATSGGPALPSAPAGLTATAGNAAVSLSWTASIGATTYSIKRANVSGGPYSTVAAGITTTAYSNTGLTNGTTYYYVVTASNSAGESAASAQASATPTAPSTSGALRVHCGGGAYTAPDGTLWSADQYYSGGQSWSTGQTITGTTMAALYQTVRYGQMTYRLPATDGAYTLKLHLAEIYFTSAGQRVFNVSVNGQNVENRLDVVAAAGGAFKALVKSYTVQASGGTVNVAFSNVVDNALVSGIELIPSSGGTGPTVPSAPTGLTATAGNASVNLTWTASAGATSYSVKRGSVSGGPYATVASGLTATTYGDMGLTNGTTYFYVVTAGNSAGESAASTQASATPTAPVSSSALRIRCGGNAYTAPDGTVWSADQYYTGGSPYATSVTITGTTMPVLYQTVRYGQMTYRLPATDGAYTLKLHLAEVYFTSTGRRVFNISVNGQTVESGLDVVAAAGGAYKALVKSYSVQATGGAVTVSFTNGVDNALISGIELVPAQ